MTDTYKVGPEGYAMALERYHDAARTVREGQARLAEFRKRANEQAVRLDARLRSYKPTKALSQRAPVGVSMAAVGNAVSELEQLAACHADFERAVTRLETLMGLARSDDIFPEYKQWQHQVQCERPAIERAILTRRLERLNEANRRMDGLFTQFEQLELDARKSAYRVLIGRWSALEDWTHREVHLPAFGRWVQQVASERGMMESLLRAPDRTAVTEGNRRIDQLMAGLESVKSELFASYGKLVVGHRELVASCGRLEVEVEGTRKLKDVARAKWLSQDKRKPIIVVSGIVSAVIVICAWSDIYRVAGGWGNLFAAPGLTLLIAGVVLASIIKLEWALLERKAAVIEQRLADEQERAASCKQAMGRLQLAAQALGVILA